MRYSTIPGYFYRINISYTQREVRKITLRRLVSMFRHDENSDPSDRLTQHLL